MLSVHLKVCLNLRSMQCTNHVPETNGSFFEWVQCVIFLVYLDYVVSLTTQMLAMYTMNKLGATM